MRAHTPVHVYDLAVREAREPLWVSLILSTMPSPADAPERYAAGQHHFPKIHSVPQIHQLS